MRRFKYLKFLLALSLIGISLVAHCDYNYKLKVVAGADMINDTLMTLVVYENANLPNLSNIIPAKRVEAISDSNIFEFEFNSADTIVQILLMSGKRSAPILNNYIMTTGDNVELLIGREGITFRGDGCEKFRMMNIMERRTKIAGDSINNLNLEIIKGLHRENNYLASLQFAVDKNKLLMDQARTLQLCNNRGVSPDISEIIYDELISRILNDLVSDAHFYMLTGNIEGTDENRLLLLKLIEDATLIKKGTLIGYHPQAQLNYLYNRLNLESFLLNRKKSYYDLVSGHFKGILWEKLVTNKLLMSFDTENNLDSLLAAVIPKVVNPLYHSLLTDLASTFHKGSKMPDFTLPDKTGNNISLRDFKGKIAFVHFWFNGCAPCSRYYRMALKEVEDHFRDMNDVVFISVSLDKNRATWREAVKSGKYTSDLAINLYTDGQGFDHQVCKDYFVKGAPSQFLINKKGQLISTNVYELGGGVNPNPDKLVNLIKRNL